MDMQNQAQTRHPCEHSGCGIVATALTEKGWFCRWHRPGARKPRAPDRAPLPPPLDGPPQTYEDIERLLGWVLTESTAGRMSITQAQSITHAAAEWRKVHAVSADSFHNALEWVWLHSAGLATGIKDKGAEDYRKWYAAMQRADEQARKVGKPTMLDDFKIAPPKAES